MKKFNRNLVFLTVVLSLALVASATFAVLDLLAPINNDGTEDKRIGEAARFGAGAGIGANLVGFPGGL